MAIDFLDALANYLIDESVVETGHIFVNKLPPDPNDCVALLGLVGPTSDTTRDVPGLQFPRFQAIIRAVDYNDANDKYQAVRAAMHGIVGITLPADANVNTDPYIRVMRCHTDQDGGPIGEDDQGRTEFSVNFTAEYHHYEA